jgi:hypothetical protein
MVLKAPAPPTRSDERSARLQCRRVAAPVSVSISVGVADITPGRPVEEIYKSRDGALYVAKVSGRNTVMHERVRSGLRTSPSTVGTMMKSERLLAAVRY